MADVFRPTLKGKKARTWYGKIRNPKTGQWHKVNLKVTDKQVARKLLRQRQEREEKIAHGMIDPTSETSMTDHLADLVRHLQQQGRDEAYRLQTEREIIKVALYCAGQPVPGRMLRGEMEKYRAMIRPFALSVLNPDKVDEFLAGLPARVSARTRNGYRTSVINLFNFLVQKRKIQFNPMLSVTRHEGEKKRKRRALPREQLQALFDAARNRPIARAALFNRGKLKGQPGAKVSEETRAKLERRGRERALLYMTAFYTGFRRGELRSLRVKHLNLPGEVPHVFLPGTLTKNGEDAKIPLPEQLAALLRGWTQGQGPDDPVFHFPKHNALIAVLKKDLDFAGIAYRDEQGRVFDFHSLRKSLGTHLRLAKVDPAVSQQFMRHSDIRLTMEIYNDDQLHDLRTEVVNKLPVFTL